MNRLWVIRDSKNVPVLKKVCFHFFIIIKRFLHTFIAKNWLFDTRPPFFESLITHKRFIFEESYISYGKRQKSCTLIVIWVKCLYLTSPTFNLSVKVEPYFLSDWEVVL